jgi:hypothetical protein
MEVYCRINTQGIYNSIISNIDNIKISYKNTCYLKPMNRLRESITLLIRTGVQQLKLNKHLVLEENMYLVPSTMQYEFIHFVP